MMEYMKKIIKLGVKGDELEVDERNLISVRQPKFQPYNKFA